MYNAQIFTGEYSHIRALAIKEAKGLNCVADETEKKPCGTCISCRVFESGNHPDIIFVSGTKASGIGVSDVREQIIIPMASKPFKYEYKIFIIEKAETLTPAAQNALLKTIEEPASYGVFLFLAPNTFAFLPTVLSRCIVQKFYIDEKQDQNQELFSIATEILNKVNNPDIMQIFALYRKFEPYKDSKETIQNLLNIIYNCYGEKISSAIKNGQQPQKTWLNATQTISETKKIISKNGNTQLAIELMLMKISRK